MKKLLFILVIVFASCSKPGFKPEWLNERAPENFTAKFETTKGDFEVEVQRKYSPKAVDRFYQLIKHDYYNDGMFYRVVPDFVAQFGNTDTLAMKNWRTQKVPDEPVVLQNTKGTISFAREGKDSRDLELFINLVDNPKLDTINFENVRGFPAFGRVIKGMNVVESLYSGYGETTMENYEGMYTNRPEFYKTFPKLDLIKKAYVIENGE